MGNREALLDGAERCLVDKGYARTTARDIASTAGVSLAAIGYHFGSKEELLKTALRLSLERWGEEISGLKDTRTFSADENAERFVVTWERVIESFRESSKLWAVHFELLAVLEREPELRRSFAADTRRARIALADLFGTIPEDDEEAEKLGAFYQVMLAGLAAQWLNDPETAPSGQDLLHAMKLIAFDLVPGERS
ncbi:MAG TPA: TetR/AcrR family transcriptional regulator [Actinophytocola sp.]|jgi:AcrR family transcriptional regulator|uniref:TetR/AcrR family transcriptional regulator n=1 Tax=Actinophytocola sp. TaxID=1872138 RepID=UPI002F93703D